MLIDGPSSHWLVDSISYYNTNCNHVMSMRFDGCTFGQDHMKPTGEGVVPRDFAQQERVMGRRFSQHCKYEKATKHDGDHCPTVSRSRWEERTVARWLPPLMARSAEESSERLDACFGNG